MSHNTSVCHAGMHTRVRLGREENAMYRRAPDAGWPPCRCAIKQPFWPMLCCARLAHHVRPCRCSSAVQPGKQRMPARGRQRHAPATAPRAAAGRPSAVAPGQRPAGPAACRGMGGRLLNFKTAGCGKQAKGKLSSPNAPGQLVQHGSPAATKQPGRRRDRPRRPAGAGKHCCRPAQGGRQGHGQRRWAQQCGGACRVEPQPGAVAHAPAPTMHAEITCKLAPAQAGKMPPQPQATPLH